MGQTVSNTDLILAANEGDGDSEGAMIFRTSGVERARISSAGVGTGWANLLGGSIASLSTAYYFSPLTYGAVFDGVTNDGPAMRACFDAAAAIATATRPAVIVLPPGTAIVDNGGTLSQVNGGSETTIDYAVKIGSYCTVVGAGRGATNLKLKAAANATILTNSDHLLGNVNISVRELSLDGNQANQTINGLKYGLHMYGVGATGNLANESSFDNIEAENVDGTGIKFDGAGLTVGPLQARHLYAHDNNIHGFWTSHAIRRTEYVNITVEGNGGVGAYIDSSECVLSNVSAKRNGSNASAAIGYAGIWFRNVTSVSATNIVAVMNQRHGIVVEGLVNSANANWHSQNNSQLSSGTYHEIYFNVNPIAASYGETNRVSVAGILAEADLNLSVASAGYGIYFENGVITGSGGEITLTGVTYGPLVTGQVRQPTPVGTITILEHPPGTGNIRALMGVIYGFAGLRARIKAGRAADADVASAGDGLISTDTTDNLLEFRSSSAYWPLFPGKVTAITYSATMATDAALGDHFTIVATNGTAFTVSTPTNPISGKRIVYDIKNSSGGAMGVVTWGAAFLTAGAFTNPANGKRRTISFYYDGTNWVEESRAAADI